MNTAQKLASSLTAIGVVVALSGCSALSAFAPRVTSAVYTSTGDLTSAEGFTAPSWLPEDATSLRISYSARDGGAILRVEPAFEPQDCPESSDVPAVPIADRWWPLDEPESVRSCPDGWSVFTSGDATFAYTANNIAS